MLLFEETNARFNAESAFLDDLDGDEGLGLGVEGEKSLALGALSDASDDLEIVTAEDPG